MAGDVVIGRPILIERAADGVSTLEKAWTGLQAPAKGMKTMAYLNIIVPTFHFGYCGQGSFYLMAQKNNIEGGMFRFLVVFFL